MTKQHPDEGIDQTDRMAGATPASGASAGQSPVDAVKETAGRVSDKAQRMASQATDQARRRAMSQLSTRKAQAADSLNDVSQAVSQVGSSLREHDHDTLAQYAVIASQEVGRAATYLRGHDVSEMLDLAQDFARNQPAIFLAGAFALGLLGARFLKSDSPRPQRSQTSSRHPMYRYPSYQPPGGPYAGMRRPGGQRGRPGYSNYGGTNGAMRSARSASPGAPRFARGAGGGAGDAPSGSYAPDARTRTQR